MFHVWLGITRSQLRCLSLIELEPRLRCRLPPSSKRSLLVARFISGLINHDKEDQNVTNKEMTELIPFPPTTIKQEAKQEYNPLQTEDFSTAKVNNVPIISVMDIETKAKQRVHDETTVPDKFVTIPIFNSLREEICSLKRKVEAMVSSGLLQGIFSLLIRFVF